MDFLVSFIAIAFYAIILAAVFIAELQLTKKRKRGTWILPVIMTVIAIFVSAQFSWSGYSRGSLNSVSIDGPNGMVGELQTAIDDKEKQMLAVGRLVFGDTEDHVKYIDLEFKEGKLIGSKEGLPYKAAVEKAVHFAASGFTGKTVSYDELEKVRKQISAPVETFSWKLFIRNIIIYAVFPIILWMMYFFGRRQMRKEMQIEKTQLNDL